jgi:uncharacterized Tic20 family protein
MNQQESNSLTSEEKLLALFSHLSIFMGGIALPIIFWAINRDKSKFVSFHALQALFFHLAYVVVLVFVIIFMIFGGAGIGMLSAIGAHSHNSTPVFFIIFIIALYCFMFLYIFGCMGYAIYIGIKAYNGEFKKYPIIGNIVYKNVYGDNYAR